MGFVENSVTEPRAALAPASRPDLPDDRIRADGDRVLVLPLRETEEGFGVYAEGTVTLVKQFRALGIDARCLHPAERRLFEGRNGVVAGAVLSIVLGVISSAAWRPGPAVDR